MSVKPEKFTQRKLPVTEDNSGTNVMLPNMFCSACAPHVTCSARARKEERKMNKKAKMSFCFLVIMIFIALLALAQDLRTIKIEASPSFLELIRGWDSNIWFFTPEDKPIRSLNELNREDIACWGMEHFQRMQELFKVLGIKGEGVKVKGDGTYNEATIKPKLYVTWAKFAQNLKGAQRVEFIEKKQRVDPHKETSASAPAQGIDSSGLDVRFVRSDEAKVKAYEGKPLTGVIVEIKASIPGSVIRLEASSVTAKSSDDKLLQPIVMFIAGGDDDIVEGVTLDKTSLAGWEIGIGKDKFKAYGSMEKMAVILEKGGGIKYTFKRGGVIQFGFIFPYSLENLSSVSILGKSSKLK